MTDAEHRHFHASVTQKISDTINAMKSNEFATMFDHTDEQDACYGVTADMLPTRHEGKVVKALVKSLELRKSLKLQNLLH